MQTKDWDNYDASTHNRVDELLTSICAKNLTLAGGLENASQQLVGWGCQITTEIEDGCELFHVVKAGHVYATIFQPFVDHDQFYFES